MKNVFITDLDRTIVHSKNHDFVCVEKYEDRNITFMTEKSLKDLSDLLKRDDFIFIPCTMRKYHQTMRIDFIDKYKPKYMICENGAQIFIDGVLDKEWESHMRTVVEKESIQQGVLRIKELSLPVKDVLNINDFYIAISFYDEKSAKESFAKIESLFEEPYKTTIVGRKMFVIHNKIDKVYSVQYLINKLNIENFITSGDSDVDKQFTSLGISVLPKHASFKHENSYITNKSGIESTDEIIEFVKNHFFN